MASTSKTTRDHDEIRNWAEERGGKPSCVRNTGGKGDIGILRIDFPGFSGEGSLEPITWEEWFQKFDESNLSLLLQEETAGGQKSNFNKIVSAETAQENEERTQSGNSRTKSAGKRGSSKKKAARKSAGKSAAASSGRGVNAKKTASKNVSPKTAAPKKTAPAKKKTAPKKESAAKKSAIKKTAPKKAVGKKSVTKKAAPKKAASKKTTGRRR